MNLVNPGVGPEDALLSPEKVRHLGADDLLEAAPSEKFDKCPLRRIVIDGLLSYGDETAFNFGRLNLLVGPNGSGKSNLIECIRLLRYAPYNIQESFGRSGFEGWVYRGRESEKDLPRLKAIINLPHCPALLHEIAFSRSTAGRAMLEEQVRDWDISAESSEQYFQGSERTGGQLLGINRVRGRRRMRTMQAQEYDPYQSVVYFKRDIESYPEIGSMASLYSEFRIYSEWSFGRRNVLREPSRGALTQSSLSEELNNLPLILSRLRNSAAHEKIRTLLSGIKESYRDYATTTEGSSAIGFGINESPFEKLILAERLSDGTLRFLAMAAVLLAPNLPPLICIEEPELGMHPDMIRMIAEMLIDAAKRTQLVVSTHSPDLLTHLRGSVDALYAFQSDEYGTWVREYDRLQLNEYMAEHPLGELWRQGDLGGNRY